MISPFFGIMEGNRRSSFKKRPATQFKKKGSNKKEKWNNLSQEQDRSSGSKPMDTVYRILCPSKKIGGVIGKGGSIIKALREETEAKITVSYSVPGSDERVIMIYSLPTASAKQEFVDGKEDETMQLHCAAQDALLKVHNRIIEEDIFGGMAEDDDNDTVVATRLLVPNNMVGCILGKGGDIIQGLRSETGASIHVLPIDHLPTCAMSTDELVQISGKPAVVKRALYEVSTRLHQNPRKDKPSGFPMPFGGQGFHPPAPAAANMLPPGHSMWPNTPSHLMPLCWMGGYGSPGFVPGGFNDGAPRCAGEHSAEFSMKVLCLAGKIGAVIGKGGINVRQLQQETGASIHVEEASTESEERIIRVSAFECLRDPKSQTIDAMLHLQAKASELSDKGIITTRMLLPSSKVGCIIGKSGSIINEMRWRTKADIRVLSKDDRPMCASEDEELVQVSGSFAVAKDALAEIASRLRARCLRGATAGTEPALDGPLPGYGPTGSFPGRGTELSWPLDVGSSAGHNVFKSGVHDHDPSYLVPPSASRYPRGGGFVEPKIPSDAVAPAFTPGASINNNTSEAPGTRLKLQDPQPGGSELVVDIHGSIEHINAAHNMLNSAFTAPGGQNNPQQGTYANPSSQHSLYQGIPPQQAPYQSVNNPLQFPYQHGYVQQTHYQNIDSQHTPYHNMTAHGPYQY
ncbi:hypothetical protein Ancab_006320 [Ancistrocladus abbreviatus]